MPRVLEAECTWSDKVLTLLVLDAKMCIRKSAEWEM